jgi:hypothetical protein
MKALLTAGITARHERTTLDVGAGVHRSGSAFALIHPTSGKMCSRKLDP